MRLSANEMPVVMQEGGLEIIEQEWGAMQVCRMTLPPGTDLTPFFAALPGGLCSVPHWGQVLEGEIHLRYADGAEETTRAGEFYHWPAPHTAWTDQGVVCLLIQPADEANRANELMAAAQAG